MKVYVDVLKYNAVVIEHDTEVHAGDNERHPDHQAPTSGDGTAVTLRHVWAPKATQMQRRHAPTHALTHMRSLTHTKRNLSNFSSECARLQLSQVDACANTARWKVTAVVNGARSRDGRLDLKQQRLYQ